jgi:hypothetical protein
MSIKFEIQIPDEPFKDTFSKGKKVELNYYGPRFIVISTFKDTNQVSTHEGFFDTKEQIDITKFNDDRTNFFVLDAKEHPLEASFITHLYNNENIDDYEEILETKDKWVCSYEEHILGIIYSSEMPYYDYSKNKFSKLKLLKPAISKEDYIKNTDDHIEQTKERLANTDKNTDTYKDLEAFLNNLNNVKKLVEKIDHWKISYPDGPE